MRFPPNFIERLRSHFLISEIISRRVPLKKFGREYKACCPFHSEKTPSFTVNDDKGFYHCFGCGAHGDVIEFIRKFERLSYPEAIESLAREAGIALPEVTAVSMQNIESQKRQQDIVEAACIWFEKQLNSARHIEALSYLEKRGLLPETIRQFRIGYAPDEKSALGNYLISAGYSIEQQIEAGLISRSDSGSTYDRFRGRIIFPIRNNSGKVIAFGGRIISSNQKNIAKYLNSPETELFKKGDVLFNLDQAKKPAREKEMLVVMEGYMDVVSCVQAGIDCAVAALGTAVTQHHLRLLWQSVKEPVFCMDGDSAGIRAMLRVAEIALPLLAPGYSIRFAVLPKGEDPDSYIQKNGRAAFEALLRHAKRLSQVIWEALASQYNLTLPEGRAGLEGVLKKLSAQISDPSVKQHFSSFFRKKIWESVSYSKDNSKKSGNNLRSAKIEHILAQDNYSEAIEILTERMLKTLIIFPDLLNMARIEEFVSNIPISSAKIKYLREAIFVINNENCGLKSEDFCRELCTRINEEWCRNFVDSAMKLPYANSLSVNDAMVLWQETESAYQIMHMQQDLALLQQQGRELDEEGLKRLIDLKNTIQEAQNARNFAPLHIDAA